MDLYQPRFSAWLNAGENTVFHQRLQSQLDNACVVKHRVLNGYVNVKKLNIADLLNGDIVVKEIQLLAYGYLFIKALCHVFQQGGQGGHHPDDPCAVLHGGNPLDGIQGIIEEMGVDLGLEHLDLQVHLLLLIPDPVFHQGGHVGGHLVDLPSDDAQLIIGLNGRISGEISG